MTSLPYHRILLRDERRTLAFRDAIRRAVKPGDVVLDIGSGTGILSFFAAEAGARRVFALERAHMADVAATLAQHLGFAGRIEVIHEYSSNVTLPERANVLVTEMLSNFGLEEQLLSVVLDARMRLLTEDATIIPRTCALLLAPVELHDFYAGTIGAFREPLYGFDLSPMGVMQSNAFVTTDIASSAHIAAAQRIVDIDLATFTDLTVRASAAFEAEREATLHGFAGFFESVLIDDIRLANANPGDTHWQQAFLALEQPVRVARGTRIGVELETHDGQAWRWRGSAGGQAFDQTTWLASPPCIRNEQ
jgi:type I protein arginine methyltransferase